MANRRMIPKWLSVSPEFNSVSEFAQLLYLMAQPYSDDFGKEDGEPAVVKALVLPMNKRPVEDFESALKELHNAGMIRWYVIVNQKIIFIPTFEDDQTGLNKRTKSKYPDEPNKNFQEIPRNSQPIEQNLSEPIRTEPKLIKANEPNTVADKYVSGSSQPDNTNTIRIVNPKTFVPRNAEETAAKDAWMKLEPLNPYAFVTTYLDAAKKGLPADMFYRFVSEIQQSKAIRPGAVFNSKVKTYFETN